MKFRKGFQMNKCTFDPTATYVNIYTEVFHCPECGNMVRARKIHPDYSLPENINENEESICENCDPHYMPLCNKCLGS